MSYQVVFTSWLIICALLVLLINRELSSALRALHEERAPRIVRLILVLACFPLYGCFESGAAFVGTGDNYNCPAELLTDVKASYDRFIGSCAFENSGIKLDTGEEIK